MSHLMSAQRGKCTWRVISAVDCQLTSAHFDVGFHAIVAHEDVDQETRRSTHCWNVDRRHSEREVPPELEVARSFSKRLVYETLYVALQSTV